ncbi:MAG: UDP-N-acetylenolpyruvoylglucosamine reductase [Coxiella sp. RIFCSPHIGHO2_12_FULL_42_15]|nr:MAG: UDP-N-acetylenolpyruvoylglucosamine reductase [Coxiella sp. RIFCSPHIGHO2_12_FULL_42_15]
MKKKQWENLQGELLLDYPLARHTSWRVGGRAACCYRPKNLVDLIQFLQQIPMSETLTWLGLGSNVLIRDAGVDGVVILTVNRLNEITLVDKNLVRVEAGVTCSKLAKFCVAKGFEDGAFFAGIPGTVGGALAMNAGAFGGETWQQVEAVEMVNRFGELKKRLPCDFEVGYREVAVPAHEYFAAGYFYFDSGDSEKAKQNISELLKERNEKQPIGTYSCGSVFRNPEGNFAGQLIELAGLKGYCLGDAQVSEKHANFILNKGNATAHEIERLIYHVADTVLQTQGVKMTPEVRIIGQPPIGMCTK